MKSFVSKSNWWSSLNFEWHVLSKLNKLIFEFRTEFLNRALSELFNELLYLTVTGVLIMRSKVSLLSCEWNFISSPVIQFSIDAAPTCFVRNFRKHLFDRFLVKRDLTVSDHHLLQEEHCVDVFNSSEPSSTPNHNSSCDVHPHMSFEFPSPVQVNTLQAKHVRCRTRQTIILHFAGAERSHRLSLAARANVTVT